MDTATVTQSVEPPGWRPPRDLRSLRVHLCGIGGSGMAGLAAFLLRRGATVSGTDRATSEALRELADRGAHVATGQDGSAIPQACDAVVASAAIAENHPELVAARARQLPIVKYAQMLGILMDTGFGIAVSGTHGKSTTTAWLTFVLRQCGLDPSFVVGAHVPQLGGGAASGGGPHFIAEACEFDRSFHNLRPRAAAILNVDEDHLDCYTDLNDIRAAFQEFARRLPASGFLVVNADDPNCNGVAQNASAAVESFGHNVHATWRAADLQLENGCYSYTVLRRNEPLGRIANGLPGKHNVMNALAVIAIAQHCGVPWTQLVDVLPRFTGAARRLEARGAARGIRVYDDYAHHPTEIRATLAAARERLDPRRVWCIFQPHQHSRTRFLLADFATSFAQADCVVVPNIYFVRDSERERGAIRAADLVAHIAQHGGEALHIPEFDAIVEHILANATDGDLVITMGAGDIWKVADELVRRL